MIDSIGLGVIHPLKLTGGYGELFVVQTDPYYFLVNVFGQEPESGNPLAVVFGASSLSKQEMQAIATRFGFSETTFVLPPERSGTDARVRIFTPADEIPFAGHPNVGTAFILGRFPTPYSRQTADVLSFEEADAVVKVRLLREDGSVAGAEVEAPRPLDKVCRIEPSVIAACGSLSLDDLVAEPIEPQMASVGLPFAFGEVRNLEALGRARPDPAAFAVANARYPHPDDRFSLFLFCRMNKDATRLRGRMFAPLSNIEEDPATGSASAALAGLLLDAQGTAAERLSCVMDQGVEMGRPCRLKLRAQRAEDGSIRASVGGYCHFVSEQLLRSMGNHC